MPSRKAQAAALAQAEADLAGPVADLEARVTDARRSVDEARTADARVGAQADLRGAQIAHHEALTSAQHRARSAAKALQTSAPPRPIDAGHAAIDWRRTDALHEARRYPPDDEMGSTIERAIAAADAAVSVLAYEPISEPESWTRLDAIMVDLDTLPGPPRRALRPEVLT